MRRRGALVVGVCLCCCTTLFWISQSMSVSTTLVAADMSLVVEPTVPSLLPASSEIRETEIRKNVTTTPKFVAVTTQVPSTNQKNATRNARRTKDHPSLIPPYHIFQIGKLRTASTYQYQLLCTLVRWKAGNVHCQYLTQKDLNHKGFRKMLLEELQHPTHSFVYKTHSGDNFLKQLARKGLTVFSSGGMATSFAIYTQNLTRLQHCEACELTEYQSLFGLSDTELYILQKHMRLYGVLRQWQQQQQR